MQLSLGKLQCQVDKLSKDNTRLKDENAKLREENYRLRRMLEKKDAELEEKISKALNKALKTFESKEIQELTNENNELKTRIFKLEQRLNISSDTSSLPPSMNPIWHKNTKIYDSRSQKKEKKSLGGQPGHQKNKLSKFADDEITETINHELDTCQKCESNDLTLIDIISRDELDFDITIKKIRHNFYKYQCNQCGEIIMSNIPKKLSAENQYGPETQALGLVLIDFGDVSYKRTRDIIKGLTNNEINPCEGYLAKLPKRASCGLKDFIFDAEEEIVKSAVVQHDDGVIKIGKKDKDKEEELNKIIEKNKEDLTNKDIEKLNEEIKKNFKGIIRAYTNGEIKLYKAHTNKSADTYKDDNILNRLSENTTVVHDHMKYNYNDIFKFKNAECNIHPIRKSRGIKANTNHKWPDKISNLLEEYNEKRSILIEKQIKQFSEKEINNLNTKYDQIIEDGIIESKTFIHKNEYADEINLLNFFKEFKNEILLWSKDFSLPFTNNLCESMIRLVKSKMKISYFFKNIESAQYYADIITYTETCYNFGINRYTAIKKLFQGNPYSIKDLLKIRENQNSKKSPIENKK